MGVVSIVGGSCDRVAGRDQNLRADTRERQSVFKACDGIEYSAFDGGDRGDGGFWRTDVMDAAFGKLFADGRGR